MLKSNSPQIEAFRQLRARLLPPGQSGWPRKLLVTSAEPGEGKSTIVANLAAVVGQAGRSVAVIDADLRLPTLHRMFKVPNERGLSNVLRSEVSFDEVAQITPAAGVTLLPSGPPEEDPAEQLGSAKMAQLIEQLASRFDLVLVDTPSFLVVADAATLVPSVGNVLLVVASGISRPDPVCTAANQLEMQGADVVVVMNRAESENLSRYYRRARRPFVSTNGKA